MPLRRQPRVGAEVTVAYLGTTVPGVIVAVDDEGRLVTVVTDDERTIEFVLNPASARFLGGEGWTARLIFDE
jgi:hypothetical protein